MTELVFAEAYQALHAVKRVVIVGGPGTGKTTLAEFLGRPGKLVRPTDALVGEGMAWSDVSDEVSLWFDSPGGWVIEGCASVRGLRKWLRAHPAQGLDATVVALWTPRRALSKGAQSMAKGLRTIWNAIEPDLCGRDVLIMAEESGY